jgi:hypothetical protein
MQVRTFNHSLKLNISLRNRTTFLYSQQPAYVLKALCNQPFLHDSHLRNYSCKIVLTNMAPYLTRPTPSPTNGSLNSLLRPGQYCYLTWALFVTSTLILASFNNFVNWTINNNKIWNSHVVHTTVWRCRILWPIGPFLGDEQVNMFQPTRIQK